MHGSKRAQLSSYELNQCSSTLRLEQISSISSKLFGCQSYLLFRQLKGYGDSIPAERRQIEDDGKVIQCKGKMRYC